MDGQDGTSPVPLSAVDDTGTTWQVRRAWPDKTPGSYVLEVLAPGRPGVRGARLRHGHFELIPPDDPKLPALRAEALRGELIKYRPYDRAVVRAEDRYIKVFRSGRAAVAAERCAQLDILLDAGTLQPPESLPGDPRTSSFSAPSRDPLPRIWGRGKLRSPTTRLRAHGRNGRAPGWRS